MITPIYEYEIAEVYKDIKYRTILDVFLYGKKNNNVLYGAELILDNIFYLQDYLKLNENHAFSLKDFKQIICTDKENNKRKNTIEVVIDKSKYGDKYKQIKIYLCEKNKNNISKEYIIKEYIASFYTQEKIKNLYNYFKSVATEYIESEGIFIFKPQ